MTAMRFAVLAAIGLTAALSLGCSGVTTPTSNKTENFSGTVAVGGIVIHDFTTSIDGEFFITVTSASPDSNTTFGLRYGQLNGTNCSSVGVTLARVGTNGFQNIYARKGNFCVAVYDPALDGNTINQLTRAESYTISVSHP